jgi:hypothetical protein
LSRSKFSKVESIVRPVKSRVDRSSRPELNSDRSFSPTRSISGSIDHQHYITWLRKNLVETALVGGAAWHSQCFAFYGLASWPIGQRKQLDRALNANRHSSVNSCLMTSFFVPGIPGLKIASPIILRRPDSTYSFHMYVVYSTS